MGLFGASTPDKNVNDHLRAGNVAAQLILMVLVPVPHSFLFGVERNTHNSVAIKRLAVEGL